MAKLPLVLIGIKIQKSLFGKMPKDANEDPVSAITRSFDPMSRLLNDEEMVNFYGDGWFEPQEIVQMQTFPGQLDLLSGLYLLESDDYYFVSPGDIIDTKKGKALVFGYSIPENWQELQLKNDPTNKRWEFEIVVNHKLARLILPPVAIQIPPSFWTDSKEKLTTLKQLTISNIPPNEFIGWLDYADALERGNDKNGKQVFVHLMRLVIESYGVNSKRLAYICWRIAKANECFSTMSEDGIFLSSLPWLKKAKQIYSQSKLFDNYESQLSNPKLEEIDEKIAKCTEKCIDIPEKQVNKIFAKYLE